MIGSSYTQSIRQLLGFALAGLLLWLMLRRIALADLAATISQANLNYITLAVVVYVVGLACKVERWRLMLTQLNSELRWTDCAGPLVASIAANNVLPFRAGDLARAVAFNKRFGTNISLSLTTLIIERLLDVVVILSFLGVALLAFGTESHKLIGVGGGFLFLMASTILLLLAFPRVLIAVAFWCVGHVAAVWPAVGLRVTRELRKVFDALIYFAGVTVFWRLIIWSLLAWLAEGLSFWIVAFGLPAIDVAGAAWLAMPVGTLATVIPTTPGYVGTFDYFTAHAMTVGGNAYAHATAYAFLIHFVIWLPATVLGGAYIILSSSYLNPLKRRQ